MFEGQQQLHGSRQQVRDASLQLREQAVVWHRHHCTQRRYVQLLVVLPGEMPGLVVGPFGMYDLQRVSASVSLAT